MDAFDRKLHKLYQKLDKVQDVMETMDLKTEDDKTKFEELRTKEYDVRCEIADFIGCCVSEIYRVRRTY